MECLRSVVNLLAFAFENVANESRDTSQGRVVWRGQFTIHCACVAGKSVILNNDHVVRVLYLASPAPGNADVYVWKQNDDGESKLGPFFFNVIGTSKIAGAHGVRSKPTVFLPAGKVLRGNHVSLKEDKCVLVMPGEVYFIYAVQESGAGYVQPEERNILCDAYLQLVLHHATASDQCFS